MIAAHAVGQANVHSVIFDMDGVIIDSHPAHRRAWQEFLRSVGKEVADHELDFILDGRKRPEILRHFLGDVSQPQLVEYGKTKDYFFQRMSLEVRPIAGVIDFIAELSRQGVRLAIATSASETRTHSTLQRLNLIDHFAVVVTGNDVVDSKPDPAIYKLVCQRLQSVAKRSLAVEDAVSGIRAAKGAGLKCVGVADSRCGEKLRSAGADHVIENFVGLSLTDLQNILHGHS
ncbi:MAG: hypothetical protein DMG71_12590 [Acidobacteria bacterium]|nr:MAG: hypothetical protein DMG71_12590 [Acidobacteriota bacterium]